MHSSENFVPDFAQMKTQKCEFQNQHETNSTTFCFFVNSAHWCIDQLNDFLLTFSYTWKKAIDSSRREDKPIFIEKMNFENELSQNYHSLLKFLEYQESDSRFYSDKTPRELFFWECIRRKASFIVEVNLLLTLINGFDFRDKSRTIACMDISEYSNFDAKLGINTYVNLIPRLKKTDGFDWNFHVLNQACSYREKRVLSSVFFSKNKLSLDFSLEQDFETRKIGSNFVSDPNLLCKCETFDLQLHSRKVYISCIETWVWITRVAQFDNSFWSPGIISIFKAV